MQPGETALDHPAAAAEPRAVGDSAAGDARGDAPGAQVAAVDVMVVAAVGEQLPRPKAGRPRRRRIGGTASTSGISWVMSLRLPPVRFAFHSAATLEVRVILRPAGDSHGDRDAAMAVAMPSTRQRHAGGTDEGRRPSAEMNTRNPRRSTLTVRVRFPSPAPLRCRGTSDSPAAQPRLQLATALSSAGAGSAGDTRWILTPLMDGGILASSGGSPHGGRHDAVEDDLEAGRREYGRRQRTVGWWWLWGALPTPPLRLGMAPGRRYGGSMISPG
jgi:hypothetical protein